MTAPTWKVTVYYSWPVDHMVDKEFPTALKATLYADTMKHVEKVTNIKIVCWYFESEGEE